MEIGLLLLRLAIGGVIAAHGAQKLFGWFGGYGISGTADWLESLGFRPGHLHARVTGLSEFGGGLLMTLGLFTPLGAAAIAGVMVVAIATVHRPKGFFNTDGGYEFNLLLGLAALTVAFMGPGSISLDAALGWDLDGVMWGLAATIVAIVTGATVFALRRTEPVLQEVAQERDEVKAA